MSDYMYFDHAATTAVRPEVLTAMQPYWSLSFGNASSLYGLGRTSKKALEAAREQVALLLKVQPAEIYFTGSGSEADNWAIKGVAFASKERGKHIIVSAIEHHAVLHSAQALEKLGFQVTYLPVNAQGCVEPASLAAAIRPDTILVSVMLANNEIGTIQPIAALAKIAHQQGILFHTDAVQAIGQIPVEISQLGVDLLSFSAHKFGGPKGVGALYIKRSTPIVPLIDGGAQERAKRASTENVAGIVGLATALQIAIDQLSENAQRQQYIRDYAWQKIQHLYPAARLNGSREQRLPGNLNVQFPGLSGEILLLSLDQQQVAASSGSACSAGSLDPSHVLLALGLTPNQAQSSLRFSFGAENTQKEIDQFSQIFAQIIQRVQGQTAYVSN